ncbi:MAG: DUF86 domain-containing protein [Bacteroidales bacterium]|nr:DUF86 domain-containing protein [Bacteroidales bacterium]
MRDNKKDKARLELILEAIDNINEYLIGVTGLEEFGSSKILCHAVLYNLRCIGECANKLSRPFVESHKEADWEGMEGLRHVLVNDYYNTKIETVWTIVTHDLLPLKEKINTILASLFPDSRR